MKVLMLSWEWPPNMVGGLGKHVVELLPELVDEDVEVHLVTPRLKGDVHDDAIISAESGLAAPNGSHFYRVDQFPFQAGNFYANTVQTNIMLEAACEQIVEKAGPFDLIHAHDWLVAFAAIAVKHEHHLPLLSTIHATEMGRNRGTLHEDMQRDIHLAEWRLVYESWRVIACSNYMAWEVRNYFGAPAEKVDVIPNGVDPREYDRFNGQDLSAFRASLARPNQKIVFYVGRLVWEKGLQVLVDAAPQIVAAYPNVRFIIAGGGDFRFELAERARQRGVGDWFFFPGRISDDDRDRLYKVADCAVFPSLYEPFGIVALEAMAAGCPVVAGDTGGLSEVINLHENGIKVNPNDPGSLAWGVLHTLQHPDWAASRAANARRDVDALYNWDRIAKMTTAVYERVVSEARAGDWAYKAEPVQAVQEPEEPITPLG
ncbi:MAG: glycosyltransferase family 4 protein [Chloroflexia bacterium]